jgi:hypothetical protein
MHYGRILALVGVLIGAVGLFLKKASSEGEAALAQLSQAPDSPFPPDLNENTWSALKNDTAWAAIVFAILLVVALVVVFVPPMNQPMSKAVAGIATAAGVIMLLVGIFATLGAQDDASTLQDGFAQAAAAGALPKAFTVSIGLGWYMLAVAGLLVAIGGIASLMAKPADSTA